MNIIINVVVEPISAYIILILFISDKLLSNTFFIFFLTYQRCFYALSQEHNLNLVLIE